jgi:DNA-binding winged helix-turn-helix (wHTH) protein
VEGNGSSSCSNPAGAIRFGLFELDVRAGELRKGGTTIRLPDQPLPVLLMLLERPGEVLLREAIRARLWPGSTIVEFDHSINSAVRRWRDALRAADRPRYVETLPRRGYRFIGQVRTGARPVTVQPSIAVLPFTNLSADKDSEYFADGLTEEILNAVSRVPGIQVAARTSTFQFRAPGQDLRKIAELSARPLWLPCAFITHNLFIKIDTSTFNRALDHTS